MRNSLLPIGTLMVASMTSCLSPSLDETENNSKAITFTTSGYSIETRATLQEAQITDLWVFDYVEGVLAQQVHQTSDASAFGSPTLTMTHGTHTLKFVASRGTTPTLDEPVLSWEKPLDTFGTQVALTIDNETAPQQNIVLGRIVSKLSVFIKDKMPADAASISLTLSNRAMGIDLDNWAATEDGEIEQTFTIPASIIGKADSNYSAYGLALNDTQTSTNVRIALFDAEGNVIAEGNVTDVPLKQNQNTILRGYISDFDLTASISVDTEWAEEQEQAF